MTVPGAALTDGHVQGHLILTNCLTDEVTRPAIERALKEDELLWLDLDETGQIIALLREVFKIHPLAIEDAQEFNQRPKVEDYDDLVSPNRLRRARPGSAAGRGACLLRRAFPGQRASCPRGVRDAQARERTWWSRRNWR